MLWLNQGSDCLRRPAQTLLAKVRQGETIRSFISTLQLSQLQVFS